MRSNLVALVCALALTSVTPALAQKAPKPITVKLKYVQDGKKGPNFPMLGSVRKLLTDGCALQVRKMPLSVRALTELKASVGQGEVTVGNVHALRIDGPDGKGSLPYAVRLVKGRWQKLCLETACAMVGRFKGMTIAILDANMNGRYDDYGKDRMVLGRSKYAFPLSPMIVTKKAVYRIEVAPNGARLTATVAEEEKRGELDFTSMLGGKLKPEMVTFWRSGPRGPEHVPVLGSKPVMLPRGIWRLGLGVMKGGVRVTGPKKSKGLDLNAAFGVYKWGAPYKLKTGVRADSRGRLRKFTPPAMVKAPRLDERIVPGSFVIMDGPPPIMGQGGETYVGPPEKADRMGFSLADPKVSSYTVEITHGGKRVNASMPTWKPWNMSGLVQKVRPYWLSYEFRCERSIAGETVVVKVHTRSPLFGTVASDPEEVKLSR